MSKNYFIELAALLPYFAEGEVVHGFGRGSKQLGVPTANFPDVIVDQLPDGIPCGVYYGWAAVDHGQVYKMVMSIGYNPSFNNTKKTMETHILHNFGKDFYGGHLQILVTGYIRPQQKYDSLGNIDVLTELLMDAIHEDIQEAWNILDEHEHKQLLETHFAAGQLNGGNMVLRGETHIDTNANIEEEDNVQNVLNNS